jgi:ribonuclease-3
MSFLHRIWGDVMGRAGALRRPLKRGFDVKSLERSIQYSIRKPDLFYQALLHRSYLQNLEEGAAISNERLEYLGDSILSLVVSEYVYYEYPHADEGELTKIRSRLVNRKALVAFARQLDLWDYMLVSESTAQSVGRGSETILADAFEALIAAIYLDGGYAEAQRFVRTQILKALHQGSVSIEDENFKSRLLELSQASGFGVPRYVILNEAGPDHDRTFTVEVRVGEKVTGIGVGKNKKDAEQAAAEQALDVMTSQQ